MHEMLGVNRANRHKVCLSIIIFIILLSTFVLLHHNFPEDHQSFLQFASLAITFIGIIISGICIFGYALDGAYTVGFENIADTRIEIPYGAMLRLKEAKESNKFISFCIASPTKIRLRDPLLLGQIRTGDYYLIFAWDMDKDMDRLRKG
jgi:hypothetical protein